MMPPTSVALHIVHNDGKGTSKHKKFGWKMISSLWVWMQLGLEDQRLDIVIREIFE